MLNSMERNPRTPPIIENASEGNETEGQKSARIEKIQQHNDASTFNKSAAQKAKPKKIIGMRLGEDDKN